ncbi:MAG TPA: hypothetical protein VMA13_08810 [Candidatus Saccharimonadales bacterium]|nr:hypothetical protein [Candidatus Saccharimonadales bacterium]
MKSHLEIRIQGANGSVKTFVQEEQSMVSRIIDGLHPARLFTTGKITIAGDYSLTAFVASKISRIDFISEEFACWEFPPEVSDLVELSEDEFHQRLRQNGSAQMEKREKPQTPGDFAMRFLHVEMLGGQQIFLAIEFVVELPADRLNKIHFLLSAPALHFRLRRGGVGVLNLANMVRFTTYPGPDRTPADAWPAHHAVNG